MSKGHDSEKHESNKNSAFLPLGITFLAVGTSMALTQDSWVIGLPFLAVGATFLVLVLQQRGENKGGPIGDDS